MKAPSAGITFDFEWERADDVAAPELAATWARLQIWVGSDCVTELEDLDIGSARRSIYCPLYPLAEWAAYNWWFLRAHNRASAVAGGTWTSSHLRTNSHARADWLRRHNLRGAGDGFRWPNLSVFPEGTVTRLVWSDDDYTSERAPVRFLRRGEAVLQAEWVELAFAEVIEASLTRLDERGVSDTPLHEEWRAITEVSSDERRFCEAAAQLGFDPYDPPPELAGRLVEAVERLGDEVLLRDFLDAIEPDLIGRGLDWVTEVTRDLEALVDGGAAELKHLRQTSAAIDASHYAVPWEMGCAEARSVRGSLGLEDEDLFEVGHLVHATESPYGGRGLQGLGLLSRDGAPAVALARRMRTGPKRFAEARALRNFVFAPERDRFLVTNAYTDRQRTERAFAAEVLAPAPGIEAYLGDIGGLVTQSDIEEVADHFRVSPLLVHWQIENQLAVGISA